MTSLNAGTVQQVTVPLYSSHM